MGRSYREVTQIHSGEWMNRLTSDTVIVADGLAQIVPGVCGMLTRILIAVVLLIGIMPELAYVLIPGGLLLVFLTWIFRRVLKRLHKKCRRQMADYGFFIGTVIRSGDPSHIRKRTGNGR